MFCLSFDNSIKKSHILGAKLFKTKMSAASVFNQHCPSFAAHRYNEDVRTFGISTMVVKGRIIFQSHTQNLHSIARQFVDTVDALTKYDETCPFFMMAGEGGVVKCQACIQEHALHLIPNHLDHQSVQCWDYKLPWLVLVTPPYKSVPTSFPHEHNANALEHQHRPFA